jgi:hypothetical protein
MDKLHKMTLKILAPLFAVVGFGVLSPASEALAAPANGAPILDVLKTTSMTQEARVFCYNRYTGRFLHWGACNRSFGYYSHPRVYCYNRNTGRFLHWGSCR